MQRSEFNQFLGLLKKRFNVSSFFPEEAFYKLYLLPHGKGLNYVYLSVFSDFDMYFNFSRSKQVEQNNWAEIIEMAISNFSKNEIAGLIILRTPEVGVPRKDLFQQIQHTTIEKLAEELYWIALFVNYSIAVHLGQQERFDVLYPSALLSEIKSSIPLICFY